MRVLQSAKNAKERETRRVNEKLPSKYSHMLLIMKRKGALLTVFSLP
jgi:hypothetical protein